MNQIVSLINDLNQILVQQHDSYSFQQKFHFEWLQTISFQLDLLSNNDQANENKQIEKENAKEIIRRSISMNHIEEESNNMITENNSDYKNENSAPLSSLKFIDDDSLLMGSDSSSFNDEDFDYDNENVSSILSGSFKELTETASSFREQWLDSVQEKKLGSTTPQKVIKFAFEDDFAERYKMSDDSEIEDNMDDEEMYERNPVEIHGKMVPGWARGDMLRNQLKNQYRIDPDLIFTGFQWECPLQDIFNTSKSNWDKRSDSGWWDHDKVTDEEVKRFKHAIGLDE